MIIDPAMRTFSRINLHGRIQLPVRGIAYVHGVIAADGFMYCAPFSADYAVAIDVKAGSWRTLGENLGRGLRKWSVAVLASDGSVIGVPDRAGPVLQVEPYVPTLWSPGAARFFPEHVALIAATLRRWFDARGYPTTVLRHLLPFAIEKALLTRQQVALIK